MANIAMLDPESGHTAFHPKRPFRLRPNPAIPQNSRAFETGRSGDLAFPFTFFLGRQIGQLV
jgi:hypothetical protein